MNKQKITLIALVLMLCSCNQTARPSWPTVTPGSTDVTPYATSAFGERTPVDQYGGDISSSAPPIYPEDTVVYEEFGQSNNNQSNSFSEISTNQNEEEDVAQEDLAPVEDWLVKEGVTLKSTIEDWSDRSGWRLIWKTNRNYKIQAGAMFRGRYMDVVSALVREFARATPAPFATFYKGNRVLIINTKEGKNAY
jgi:hypothetical protein